MARTAIASRTNGKTAPSEMPGLDAAPSDVGAVQISRLEAETLRVPILGTSTFVCHRFSEKAKKQMLDAMQGRKTPKEPKDPEAEYLAAFYRYREGDTTRAGFPVIAFKTATIGGCRYYAQLTMVSARQCLFFSGEPGLDRQMLAEIIGEPEMQEDVVRVGRGGTDLRYRPAWNEWSTTLDVTYVKSMLTRDSVLSLIDAGGLGCGVGEWRPEKGGVNGTYRVDPSKRVEVIS